MLVLVMALLPFLVTVLTDKNYQLQIQFYNYIVLALDKTAYFINKKTTYRNLFFSTSGGVPFRCGKPGLSMWEK